MLKYYVKRVSGSDVWGIEVGNEVWVFVSVARQCRQGVVSESQSGGGGVKTLLLPTRYLSFGVGNVLIVSCLPTHNQILPMNFEGF